MESLKGEALIIRGLAGLGRSRENAVSSKIAYLMWVSFRFGICLGSVGLALKPYVMPTLVLLALLHLLLRSLASTQRHPLREDSQLPGDPAFPWLP